MISKLLSSPSFRQTFAQFLRFAVVGTIGAVIDFGSYNILTRLLDFDTVYCLHVASGQSFTTTLSEISLCRGELYPIIPANLISVFLAVICNFLLNKFWTFSDRRVSVMAAQGFGYFVMSVIAWALNQFFTGYFASRLLILEELVPGHADNAAKALAIAAVLLFNFFGSKYIIFRKRSSD